MIDWQTDEDALWLDEEPTAVSPKRPFRWLIFLFSLLIIGGWIAFQIAQRIDNNIQRTRNAVRQQHFLIWEAAIAQDSDLFSHLIASSKIEWRILQTLLVQENLSINKAPLNLWLDSTKNSSDIHLAVHLSPNLKQAEVETIIPYVSQTASGELVSVSYRLLTHYQLWNGAWVQYPLDQQTDFWGERLLYQGKQLDVFYPDRDKGIARRLAEDLDGLMVELCRDERFSCFDEAQFRLIFNEEPTAVYRLSDNVRTKDIERYVTMSRAVYDLKLPAPTLVGYPMNEASYEALYRGYGAWMVAIFMKNLPTDKPIRHEDVIGKLAELEFVIPAVSGYQLGEPVKPPLPFPDRPLLLTCGDADISHSWLFFPESEQWEPIGRPFDLMTAGRAILKPEPYPFDEHVENRLLTAVPENQRPLQLEIVSYRQRDGQTAVVAQRSEDHPDLYVFLEANQELTFWGTIRKKGHAQLPVSFMGNGRYISIISYTYARSTLSLIDLENEYPLREYFIEGVPFERIHWSSDNQWFVLISDRALKFVAPDYDYEKFVYHNKGGCTAGMWVN